jgi:AraC-like DNA-binding protein/predicted transcriptional regulator YdeE
LDKRIQQAYDYIKKNHRQKLLLHDLAALVDLSPFHFQRLFARELGESPAQCVNRVRLERAAHMCRANSDLSMSELATDCGFSSPATFSRAFSKAFGMSPAAFSRLVYFGDEEPVPPEKTAAWKVQIEYFPGFYIYYTHTSIYRERLLDDFEAALSFCELEGIRHPSPKMIGICTYLTIHSAQKTLNYYAGVQLAEGVSVAHLDKIFFVPEGKYACFNTDHSYHELLPLVTDWKAGWLDQKPYAIRDLFIFEIIDPATKRADYPRFRRRICIPIRHK